MSRRVSPVSAPTPQLDLFASGAIKSPSPSKDGSMPQGAIVDAELVASPLNINSQPLTHIAPCTDQPPVSETRVPASADQDTRLEIERVATGMSVKRVSASGRPSPNQETKRKPSSTALRFRDPPTRVVAIEDVPAYSPDLVIAAKRAIKEAPTERVLLTYKEIYAFFGISRATVARRLKDGLVPGIRMCQGRVLEDGPVRRLDRTQVLYLLLAVRSRDPNPS